MEQKICTYLSINEAIIVFIDSMISYTRSWSHNLWKLDTGIEDQNSLHDCLTLFDYVFYWTGWTDEEPLSFSQLPFWNN